MIIEFRVENHRSLRDEQVLTMEADTVRAGSTDTRPRQLGGVTLLPTAGIYGANASGKSNVLAGLAFMREAVLYSHRVWPPDDGVPRDPFAWGEKTTAPSTFEITFIADNVRFEYGFVASDTAFLEEWLYAWPGSKRQMWLEREENNFKFGENLKGENELIEEVTRTNALFISAAVQHKHLQLEPIYSWFRSMRPINVAGKHRGGWGQLPSEFELASLLEREPSSAQLNLFTERQETLLSRFRNLLKAADIGIEDLRLSKEPSDERRMRRPSFMVKHKSDIEDSWLSLEEESRGTQTLVKIAIPMLQAIKSGGLILMDELESSLHPSLAQAIVRQFNSPETNPRNAQLIFTTHDTNLLGTICGEPDLRRDQVWLTEKDDRGATVLYPATDYKPRKGENLERGYIQGRYGAIPFLGNFSLLGE